MKKQRLKELKDSHATAQSQSHREGRTGWPQSPRLGPLCRVIARSQLPQLRPTHHYFLSRKVIKQVGDKSLEQCFLNHGMLPTGGIQPNFTKQHRNTRGKLFLFNSSFCPDFVNKEAFLWG